jgi:hypothetical protein
MPDEREVLGRLDTLPILLAGSPVGCRPVCDDLAKSNRRPGSTPFLHTNDWRRFASWSHQSLCELAHDLTAEVIRLRDENARILDQASKGGPPLSPTPTVEG